MYMYVHSVWEKLVFGLWGNMSILWIEEVFFCERWVEEMGSIKGVGMQWCAFIKH